MPETKNGSTSVHHVRLQMDQSNDERGAISIVTDSYSQETGGVTLAESAGAGLSNGRIASSGRSQPIAEPKRVCDTLRAVGDSDEAGSQGLRLRGNGGDECAVRETGVVGAKVNGYWRDAAWIYCKDGKYRAVERTARGLADEYSRDLGRFRVGDTETYITHPLQAKGKARVLRLRGYGDAIVLEQAIAWIRAVMEVAL